MIKKYIVKKLAFVGKVEYINQIRYSNNTYSTSKNDLPALNHAGIYFWYNVDIVHRDNDLPAAITKEKDETIIEYYKNINGDYKLYRYNGYSYFYNKPLIKEYNFMQGICLELLESELDQ